jgi:hypothetical protein
MENKRYCYIGLCKQGIDLKKSSGNWDVMRFNNKKERKEWLEKHVRNDKSVIAKAMTRKEAYEIFCYRLWTNNLLK